MNNGEECVFIVIVMMMMMMRCRCVRDDTGVTLEYGSFVNE